MPIIFEWDERKRLVNLAKHGIDFVEAKDIWANDVLEAPSPRHDEERFIAYGILDGRIVAVVFMRQGQRLRLISARRARDYERKAYKDAFGRGS
jgi:uncharacterized DUF497 family protein